MRKRKPILTLLLLRTILWDSYFTVLWMKKLKPRKPQWPAQAHIAQEGSWAFGSFAMLHSRGHTVRKWQTQDQKPGLITSTALCHYLVLFYFFILFYFCSKPSSWIETPHSENAVKPRHSGSSSSHYYCWRAIECHVWPRASVPFEHLL